MKSLNEDANIEDSDKWPMFETNTDKKFHSAGLSPQRDSIQSGAELSGI